MARQAPRATWCRPSQTSCARGIPTMSRYPSRVAARLRCSLPSNSSHTYGCRAGAPDHKPRPKQSTGAVCKGGQARVPKRTAHQPRWHGERTCEECPPFRVNVFCTICVLHNWWHVVTQQHTAGASTWRHGGGLCPLLLCWRFFGLLPFMVLSCCLFCVCVCVRVGVGVGACVRVRVLNVLVETSRSRNFTDVVILCVQVLNELVETSRSHDFTDVVILHEHRGEPDGLVVCHLPFGPTAYFGLHNVVLRHDIGQKKEVRVCFRARACVMQKK